MRQPLARLLVTLCCVLLPAAAVAQAGARPPLGAYEIDTMATLLKLEDARAFAEAVLDHALRSFHPEVRRRAVLAIGRIAAKPVASFPEGDVVKRARVLLDPLRADANPELVATVAFALGEMKDAASVGWLGDQLNGGARTPSVATQAARALGRIRTPEAHAALAKYLTGAPLSAPTAVAGEALLAMGRFTPADDITPVLRWTASKDVELRWRAAWALVRSRNAAGLAPLLKLAADPSPEVRFWAMRGLAPAVADEARIDRAITSSRLRAGLKDPDRRVRTEALRALAAYDDDESFAAVLGALESPDSWLSVSAAEGLANAKARVAAVTPKLVAAAAPAKPAALRATALASLVALGATDAATEIATALAKHESVTIRTRAEQTLERLGPGAAPARGGGAGAGGGRSAQPMPAITPKTDAEYRAMVVRWVVPDYAGAPKPRSIWETEKGTIELELNSGDAPLAMEYFVKSVESGDIVGTEFGRVVPNFVAQQRTITGAPVIRDEVNVRGLTRANLSWASAGLDTGRPGYTLGSTPQPHNEGDFTALGRVIRGMDVVDRIELGDRITAARMVK